ncbi:zinc transport system substrate-binding protein [Shimia isoporae]|uniref:High-affinity zinc uptake system protein ZnuA n=1 Tax=Shimia isoporae TaxID=647720 RepID=A0A4R1NBB8_9RHOB|nr:zinc ABC transporter substrate-binding protein [Shimia isoporae]TCL00716.1 zinc transport system substrate-binding protein [Shimia isoporae]
MRILPASFVALLGAGIAAQAEAPRVTTDIAPVHSLVSKVMEGVGTPDLLIKPGVSPHGYALRPSEARSLQDADLVVWIGPKLTPQLEKTIESLAGDAHHMALLNQEGTVAHDYRSSDDFEVASDDDHGHDDHAEHDDHGDEEHAGHDDHDDHGDEEHAGHDEHEEHGDEDHAGHDDHDHHDHSGTDSHAWLDPENARVWLGLIAAELSEIDPDNAATYAENAKSAQAELDVLEADIAAKLEPVHASRFVVFHDAYQYFEKRFDLKAAGAIRVGDASSASAARLREVRTTLSDNKIECVFSEPQFPDEIVASVSEGLDIKTAEVDPHGATQEIGPGLYYAVLSNLADNFAACLDHDH